MANYAKTNELEKNQNDEGDLVQKTMGDFGWWQVIICVALSLLKVSVAWHQLAILFLAPPQDFWCKDPDERANLTIDTWRNISSPEDGIRGSCYVSETHLPNSLDGQAGNESITPCLSWDFDTSIFTSTIIDEWQLVCSREMLAHASQTVYMSGILIGNFAFGFIADKYGRKGPMIWSILVQIASGLGTAFCNDFILFLVLRFVEALATGGAMVTSFVICMEIVGPKRRALVSVLYHIPFSIGHLTLPGISYLLRNWRHFQVAISLPSLFLLAYYWIVPESPRWLLTEGRISEATVIVENAARKNGLPCSGISEKLKAHCNTKLGSDGSAAKGSFADLMIYPNLRKKTLCIGVNWLVCGVCFFGLAQYLAQIDGNIFLNVAAGGMIEVPGSILCVYLLEKIGRKKTLASSQFLAGVACIIVIFIPESYAWATVALATTGIVAMSIAFPTLYLYSGELFPTVVRNVGVGFSSMCARIGSMAAPFFSGLSSYGHYLPPLLFGVFPLVGCVLCLLLPETRNTALPDTIEDGEMSKKKVKEPISDGVINQNFYREWKEGSKL